MNLVDTSVWIEHLRRGDDVLQTHLDHGRVLCHPFVIGEIALGGVKRQTIDWLRLLPIVEIAADVEVLRLIQSHSLAGRGIGYVDAHLLASCLLTPDARPWTLDKRLRSAAEDLEVLH